MNISNSKRDPEELLNEINALKQKYNTLLKDYNTCVSENGQNQIANSYQNELLSKITQFSIDLSMLPATENLSKFFAVRIKEISGAVGLVYSVYDEEKRVLIPQHLEIEPGLLKKTIDLLGGDLRKFKSPVNDQTYQHIIQSVVAKYPTISDASFGALPTALSSLISKLLKADFYIGMTFLMEGKLFGTALLAMSRNHPEPPVAILENIAFLVAVSLRRNRAEDSYQFEKWRLQSIIDSTQLGTWEWNVQLGVFTYNEQWAQMLGYSLEELKPLDISVWYRLVHPDDLKISTEILHRHFAGELPYYDCECRMKHKQGHWVWVLDSGSVISRTDDGKPLMMFGTHTNISKQKKNEESLQNERLLLRTLIDNIPDSIYTKDWLGRKTLANTTDVLYSGAITESELLGKDDFALYPKEIADEFYAVDKTVMLTGQAVLNREEYLMDGNGEKHWLLSSKVPLRDQNNQIIGLMGIGRDITQRKQAEDALIESEKRANALIAAIPDLIFILTREGEIIDYKADIKELAFQSESILGKRIREILPPEFVALLEEKISLTLQSRKLQEFDYQLEIPHLGALDFEARMQPYGIDKVVAIVRNVTERKKAQAEIIRQNEDLVQLNSEKDKFFSIIAHDLRGPIGSFMGLTEKMAEGMKNMTLDELQKMAEVMKKSASGLYGLLGNLLEWSRMQRELIQYEPVCFALKPSIAELIQFAFGQAQSKQLEIHTTIPEHLVVCADANMFASIIRNLVSNAVKFTPKGGKITISAQPFDSHFAEISIQDTGIGMNTDTLNNIFQLTIDTNRPGTDGESSTGLGLIICKDFVERHGGTLLIESKEGMGSTFRFKLPLGSSAPTAFTAENTTENTAVSQDLPRCNLKILIAEDDETSGLLIEKVVETVGKQILKATTGPEAVELCRQNLDIDLILMDVQLPGMNGYEVTRQIRDFNKDVVIIAQTAYGLSGDREKALQAGCNGYLSKPIDISLLKGLIQQLVCN